MRAFVSLIAFVVLLTACGYKGALYLPPEEPVAQKAAPETDPENENKKPPSP